MLISDDLVVPALIARKKICLKAKAKPSIKLKAFFITCKKG